MRGTNTIFYQNFSKKCVIKEILVRMGHAPEYFCNNSFVYCFSCTFGGVRLWFQTIRIFNSTCKSRNHDDSRATRGWIGHVQHEIFPLSKDILSFSLYQGITANPWQSLHSEIYFICNFDRYQKTILTCMFYLKMWSWFAILKVPNQDIFSQ